MEQCIPGKAALQALINLGSPVVRTVTITAADDIQLTADEWGDPSGPPVLMCHGAGHNRHAWKTTAQTLADRGWFVLTVDARGHGDSDWSTQALYDSEDIGRDIVALLQRFESPPAIVGASMGGMAALAAQRTAARQLYIAVVLVDITPDFDMEGAQRVIAFMSGNPEGFADLDEAADAIAAYNPHRARPSEPSGLARVLRQRSDGRWIWRWDPSYVSSKPGFNSDDAETMASHMERTRRIMTEGAQAVTTPMLLVRGGQSDLVTPEAAQSFCELVPDAEFVDVAGTGHMVAGDDNDAFTDAVSEFLSRHHPV